MLRTKLKDNTGASITYALLLFLVCAVVSSVVLAAGTAASGRISGSVDSDQKYYSVTSAAKFMKELLDGKTVVVKTVVTTEGATETTENKIGVNTDPDQIELSDYNSDSLDLVTEAAACYTGLIDTGINSRSITLGVGGIESLNSFIQESVDKDSGRITFVISNTNDPDAIDSYTLTMTFDPEVSVKTSSKTERAETPGGTRKKVKTTTTTMKWILTSMG